MVQYTFTVVQYIQILSTFYRFYVFTNLLLIAVAVVSVSVPKVYKSMQRIAYGYETYYDVFGAVFDLVECMICTCYSEGIITINNNKHRSKVQAARACLKLNVLLSVLINSDNRRRS